MDVFEHENRPALRTRDSERCDQSSEQFGFSKRRAGVCACRVGSRRLGEQLGDGAQRKRRGIGRSVIPHGAQRGAKRREFGDRFGDALDLHDAACAAAADRCQRVRDEPRFSDAGFPVDERDRSASAGERAPRVVECGNLPRAPHETARTPGRCGREAVIVG